MKEKLEQILLIAGSGQNVGKTTLACQIIQNSKEQNPVAVKISPHFHKVTHGLQEIKKGENWALYEETDKNAKKDSSRYLQNGAVQSFLVLAIDSGLNEAFSAVKELLPAERPVIIESASLIKIIDPGFFIVVLPEGECKKKDMEPLLHKSDLIIISDGKHFYPAPEKVTFNKTWALT